MGSLFNSDLKESEIIGDYLDQYFYNKLVSDKVISGYHRNDDIQEQYEGIDVIVHNHGRNYYIDEKAQAHYKDGPLPTFAFEVSYLKDRRWKEGWLTSGKKNDFWLMIWPQISNSGKEGFSIKAIEKLELMLIKVERMRQYLEAHNWSRDDILKFDYFLRTNGHDKETGKVSAQVYEACGKRYDPGRFYWYTSAFLEEKPINVVVRKNELKRIASSHYIVRKELYEKQNIIDLK